MDKKYHFFFFLSKNEKYSTEAVKQLQSKLTAEQIGGYLRITGGVIIVIFP